MDEFVRLGNEKHVFRLVPLCDAYYDAGLDKPHPKAFELSSQDKRQTPPMLSVFDTALTSVNQARNVHGKPSASPFVLRVGEIREIKPEVLDVFSDPIASVPGGAGHCGIVGLFRVPGKPRSYYQNLRVQLADSCIPYDQIPTPFVDQTQVLQQD